MAKQARKRNRQKKKVRTSPFRIYWEKKNYIFLFLGFFLLIIGFYFMSINPWNSTSALIISPIILFIAYVIIFPASILYRSKLTDDEAATLHSEGKTLEAKPQGDKPRGDKHSN